MKLIDDKAIKNITSSLGLDLVSQNKKNEILSEILELISVRAGLRVIKNLSESEKNEFNSIKKDNLDEMEDFLMSKNSNTKNIFEEEIKKTMEEILNSKINLSKNE